MNLCSYCGKPHNREIGAVNRALKAGLPLFCNKVCAGLHRRKGKTAEQKKAEKSAYDKQYRAKNIEKITTNKKEWFAKNYDPVEAAKFRKENMARHVEYCRRPEYKEKKKSYDFERSNKEYADFCECWRLLQELEKQIRSQATAYERRVANGYYQRSAQRRRRELWKLKKNSMQVTLKANSGIR